MANYVKSELIFVKKFFYTFLSINNKLPDIKLPVQMD